MRPLEHWYRQVIQHLIKKPVVTLTRGPSTNHGTRGLLYTPDANWHALELPWRDNEPNFSCIPAGTYDCVWHHSPSKGWVYKVLNVPGRTHILIHIGNWAGDTKKGFKSKSLGCILLGKKKGFDNYGQGTVWNSGTATKEFYKYMNKKPFKLIIIDSK